MGDILFGSIALLILVYIGYYLFHTYQKKGSVCTSCKICMASEIRGKNGKIDLLAYVAKMENKNV